VKFASFGRQGSKRDIRIKMDNHEHLFKAEEVTMITEARVEELFEYVQKELCVSTGRINYPAASS
jgi:cell division ATPase FtsA